MSQVKIERYAAYKDSGVEWLGEVPERWEVVRLKDLGLLQNGISKGGDYFGFGFPFISYGNIYNNTISLEKIKTYANSTLEDQQAYSCKSGDVFFTRTSETIEEIGFSATCLKTIPKSVFSGFVIRFRPTSKKLSKEFSKFYFSANILRYFFSKEVGIVTRASLGQGLLNKLSITLPALSEQAAIAAYLDSKTAQIDRQIDLLSQKATQYGKLKQSLINETVTRGLDKSVPMKDSGVEWIGEVPVHWEITAVTNITDTVSHKNHPNEELLSVYRDYGVIIKSSRDDNNNKAGANLSSYKLVEPGFLVINKMKAWQGSLGISEFRGIVSPAYITCKTDKKIVNRSYLHHLLRCRKYINEYNRLSFGVRVDQWDMRYDDFKYVAVLLPPMTEQTAIAAYLDTKTTQIDRIVATINQQIDLLKELRKALINDVVTGKIKVFNQEYAG